MTDNRKIQLEAEVSDNTKAGFDSIKRGAADMGQAVAQSTAKAGDSVARIGDGSEGAAQKLDKSTKSIIGSVERATAALNAGERGTAKYFETLANQRGANADALKPYIEQLKQAELAQQAASGSLNKIGISAGQTAAALRSVPAQFTDIVTSLQGGQAPLTVLLQQGGQLKDLFGGVGEAAKALGGYLLGLINPYTVVAAAIGAIAFAYAQGSKEADAYNKALILTGNASGSTAGQLQAYAQQISAVVGTQGKAAEAVTAFAASGRVANENLKDFAQTAIQFERATGTAIDETVKKFVELRNAPLAASLKLNEGTNYLTESLYRQIKALEDQGRATEAASLAQKAFNDSQTDRSAEIVRNLGSFERGWLAIKDAIKGAADAALSVGRATLPAQELLQVRAQIQTTQNRAPGFYFPERAEAQKQADLAPLLAREAQLVKITEAEKSAAEAARARGEAVQASAAFDKAGEKFISDRVKFERDLAEAVNTGVAAGRSQAEILTRINDIRDDYAKKNSGAAGTGQGEVAAIRAQVKAQQEYLAQLKAQTADSSTLGDQAKLTDGQQKVLKIQEELKTSITGVSRAEKERALAAAETLVGVEKMVIAQERQNAGLKAAVGAYDKLVERTGSQADSIRQQAIDTEAANLSLGKSKTAIEAIALAQLKANLAEADASDSFAPKYVAALNEKVKAQERYVAALEQTEVKQLSQSNAEYARVVSEETRTLDEQARLVGATRVEREKLIGQRKVELELAKRISEIDKAAIPEAEKVQLRAEAAATSVVAANNAATRAVQEDWQRTSDIIESSLTDALLRGFESGKGFLQNLVDTTKNLFATLVLRPQIQAVFGLGGSAGAAQASGGSGGSGFDPTSITSLFGGNSIGVGIGSGLVSTGNFLVSAGFDKFGAAVSSFADSAASFSNLAYGGAGLAGSLIGNLIFGGKGLSGIGGSLGSIGGLALSGAGGALAATTIGATLGSALPVVGTILGGLAGSLIGSLFGGGTPYNSGGAYQAKADGTGFRPTDRATLKASISTLGRAGFEDFSKRGSPQLDEATKTLATGLQSTLVDILGTFDKTASDVFVAFRANGKKATGNVNIGGVQTVLQTGTNDPQKAFTEFADFASRSTLQALDRANLPQFAKDLLAEVSNAPGLEALQTVAQTIQQIVQVTKALQSLPLANLKTISEESVIALAKLTGGLSNLNDGLSAYYAAFYTDAERTTEARAQLTASLAALGVAIPSTREQYRALVNAQDLSTDAGRKLYAQLIALAPAFASITQDTASLVEARNQFNAAIASITDGLLGESQRIRGLLGNGGQSFAEAQAQFAVATASARAGNQDAAKSLPGLSQTLLGLAEQSATSAQQLALIRASTAASLDTTAAALSAALGVPFQASAPAAVSSLVAPSDRSTTDDTIAALKAMQAELAAMRALALRTELNTRKTADTLVRVSADGDSLLTTATP